MQTEMAMPERIGGRKAMLSIVTSGAEAVGRACCRRRERWPGAFGAGYTVEIRPLSEFLIPSIYQTFRASQNANRWRIINQMFAKSLAPCQ